MTTSIVKSIVFNRHAQWRAQVMGNVACTERCPLIALENGILDAVSRASIDIARKKIPGYTDRAKIGWAAVHCNEIMNNPVVANPCPEAAFGNQRRVSDYLNDLREEAESVIYSIQGMSNQDVFHILLPDLGPNGLQAYYVASVPSSASDEEIYQIIRQHFNKD